MQVVDEYIRNLRHLPPAPRVVPDLMRLLNQPDVDSSQVVKMISYDPSLTVNVLRICNSAYFGSALPTADVQEAVTRLGFQQVYQLVAAATGARLLSPPQPGYGLEQGELWKHSVASAVAAQLIARKLGDNENLVFTAALLHDIGKTILSHSLNGAYSKIVTETERNEYSLIEAETKLLGVHHGEVGGQLLQHWRFPANIVAAVWFHHTPKGAAPHQRLASFVYLGNMIAYFMGHGYGHAGFALRGRTEVLSTLHLSADCIPQLMMETYEQMHMIEALFSLGA
jgi:putative nucleotidyltransferase with HDIG domain